MESHGQKQTVIGLTLIIVILMTLFIVWQYTQAASVPGTIVIPAGNTYLGKPTPTIQNGKTKELRGHIYPYILSIPDTLQTTVFPNDPYDLIALVSEGIDPASNVLIGLDNLSKNPTRAKYISMHKIDYVREWWQQFSSLKGVAAIDQFTNAKGLKGYRAKYMNAQGETPNTDIFFEIPSHPDYIIHMANGILDPVTFDNIVNSVAWKP